MISWTRSARPRWAIRPRWRRACTLLWAPELAAKGFLQELKPEDVGYPSSEFWPSAMKSVTWKGKTYGIPTYNETMALIWNAELFEKAGLNPEQPPATWDDLVRIRGPSKKRPASSATAWSRGGTPATRPIASCRNAGPMAAARWTRPTPSPTYEKVMLDSPGTKAALQASYDMYVRDKSVPVSALTNTQNENQDPFVAGNLGMMISHPSEYAVMLAKAAKAHRR